jgi:hypothetical protein
VILYSIDLRVIPPDLFSNSDGHRNSNPIIPAALLVASSTPASTSITTKIPFHQPDPQNPAIRLQGNTTNLCNWVQYSVRVAPGLGSALPKFTMETIETAPTVDSFTRLEEHQQQTPYSFFGGPAILHLHCSDAKVLVSRQSLGEHALLQSLLPSQDSPQDSDEEVVISNVQVWVSSR